MDLGVFAEPAPEQGLFDRSDNVSFAAKGVPAPTFSPGFKTFDAAIGKYYHQAIDNPESLDYPYFTRFCQAYAHAARLIANRATRPQWSADDKYAASRKSIIRSVVEVCKNVLLTEVLRHPVNPDKSRPTKQKTKRPDSSFIY